jgi:N-acetyl-gamma-glutamylphosphate reductase
MPDMENVEEQALANQEIDAQENSHEESSTATQNEKEENFAALRKKHNRILRQKDREIDDIKSKYDYLEQELKKLQSSKEPQIDDNDLVTLAQSKEASKKVAKEILEEERYLDRQRNFRDHLRKEFNDFDDVMTDDNIYSLQEDLPEIAEAIARMPDRVKGATAAYKAIKKMLKEGTIEKEVEMNKKALQKQAEKPLSVAALDKRPIAKAARYSDDDYSDLWKEMQDCARKA